MHLDHASPARVAAFLDELQEAAPDALVLTGDLADAKTIAGRLARIANEFGRPVYFVLGNHDFYGGEIASVRRDVDELGLNLKYLTRKTVVPLNETTALIGHDGWYDAYNGSHRTSHVILSDWHMIREFLGAYPKELLVKFRALAKQGADHVLDNGRKALLAHETLLVATHVPPFRAAATYGGKPSDDAWAPWFTSRLMGDALTTLAKEHPAKQIRVLCGHSHGGSDIWPLPNLRVTTGAAVYGEPKLQGIFEV